MPSLNDRAAIRAILESDRAWSVYALGDLAPGQFEHCSWIAGQNGLALIYGRFAVPVLFAIGDPPIGELPPHPRVHLQLRGEALDALGQRYEIAAVKPMWRMVLGPRRFHPEDCAGTVRLGPADLRDLEALYADGEAAGEAPDFFYPTMLSEGLFFGIRESGALVCAAGTHLVSREESVAAVGNIYTRRDRRGRGLAGKATTALAAALSAEGIRTIALNVNQRNEGAIRVYERVGFERYCAFYEGVAVYRSEARVAPPGAPLIE